MRRGFGVQALGWPCLMALVLMLLWGTFTHDPFVWLWMLFWLLCLIKRRVESVKAANSNQRVHSQYDGWPFDAIRYVRSEKAAKLVVEPILVGIFGSIIWWAYTQMHWPHYGLPAFILTGVFTLPFVEAVKQAAWERRLQGMQDARMEQEAIVRESRDRFGDS